MIHFIHFEKRIMVGNKNYTQEYTIDFLSIHH